MVTSIDDCYEIIERLRNERNDLRRQLAEAQEAQAEADSLRNKWESAERTIQMTEAARRTAIDENPDLRRQLEATQTELDQARQERDRARRALHLRDLEDTGLYDAYGQSLK